MSQTSVLAIPPTWSGVIALIVFQKSGAPLPPPRFGPPVGAGYGALWIRLGGYSESRGAAPELALQVGEIRIDHHPDEFHETDGGLPSKCAVGFAGIGARVSTINCFDVSSRHTTGRAGSRGL